jgi:aarF domain-containing kinase
MPEWSALIEEIEKQFKTEFDYSREAQNLQEVSVNMAKAFPRRRVLVPKPHLEMCSRHVLVMQFVEGVKIAEAVKVALQKSVGHVAAHTLLGASRRAPNAGSAHRRPGRGDACLATALGGGHIHGLGNDGTSCLLWHSPAHPPVAITGGIMGAIRAGSTLRMARARLEELIRIHGYQVLVDGVFNGDPHPGNVLLMPGGGLGLIDYGQVKRISKEQRLTLAQLIIALADGHTDKVRNPLCLECFITSAARCARTFVAV